MNIAYLHTGVPFEDADELSIQMTYWAELLHRQGHTVRVLGYAVNGECIEQDTLRRDLAVTETNIVKISKSCKCISDAEYHRYASRWVHDADAVLLAGDVMRYAVWGKIAQQNKIPCFYFYGKPLPFGTALSYSDTPLLYNVSDVTDLPYVATPTEHYLVLYSYDTVVPTSLPAPVHVTRIYRTAYEAIKSQLPVNHYYTPYISEPDLYRTALTITSRTQPRRHSETLHLLHHTTSEELTEIIKEAELYFSNKLSGS